jgi:hypothetical protein
MTAIGKVALGASILLVGFSAYMQFTSGLGGDQDWELLAARMLLDGKKLYADNFTVIAPLIFYLYTLPVFLSLHLSFLQDFQALVLLVLCGIALTILACIRLIQAHPAFAVDRRKQMQFVMLLCFLFIIRIAPSAFGDREHLFLVLTFPYLLRWMPSLSHIRFSVRLRVLIGAMAAIGFCIKPHFFLLFAGIQLMCLPRKDLPCILNSIENRIIYGIGVLYLLCIALFTPEYFTVVLPMAFLTYSALAAAGSSILFNLSIIVTLVLTFAMFRLRYASPYRRDIYYFAGVSLFLFAYVAMSNRWSYTYQPLITLLLFINAFVLWEFLYLKREYSSRGLPARQFLLGASACVANLAGKLAVALIYCYTLIGVTCHGDSTCPGFYEEFVNEVRASPQPHTFGTIGMNFALWARVSKLSAAHWETRFPQLWMIPKFFNADEHFTSRHQWILDYVAGALAEDLERNEPDVVFVDVSDSFYAMRLEKPVDWVESFNHFANFKDAWQHYTYVHTIDICKQLMSPEAAGFSYMANCRYDVYHRRP